MLRTLRKISKKKGNTENVKENKRNKANAEISLENKQKKTNDQNAQEQMQKKKQCLNFFFLFSGWFQMKKKIIDKILFR